MKLSAKFLPFAFAILILTFLRVSEGQQQEPSPSTSPSQPPQEQPVETSAHPSTTTIATTASPAATTQATPSKTDKNNSGNSSEGTTTLTTGAPHGSHCIKNEDCDGSIGLTCNPSSLTCDCPRPTDMNFDKIKKACLVLESFSCGKVTEGNKTSEFDCTKNAACVKVKGEEKMCRCSEGYNATAIKTCQAGFGSSCSPETNPCEDSLAHLVCNPVQGESTGKCGCYNAKENIFENGSCVALADGLCFGNSIPFELSCTANAICKVEEHTASQNRTGKCHCDSGFKRSADGRCGHSSDTAQFASSALMVIALALLANTINTS